jgi:hypothetical protein
MIAALPRNRLEDRSAVVDAMKHPEFENRITMWRGTSIIAPGAEVTGRRNASFALIPLDR